MTERSIIGNRPMLVYLTVASTSIGLATRCVGHTLQPQVHLVTLTITLVTHHLLTEVQCLVDSAAAAANRTCLPTGRGHCIGICVDTSGGVWCPSSPAHATSSHDSSAMPAYRRYPGTEACAQPKAKTLQSLRQSTNSISSSTLQHCEVAG